jgi:hypothetical protein
MTAAELLGILVSADFKREVEQVSCYLASIAPERPMVYCLARQLWNAGRKFQLEVKLKDMVVEENHFEFKACYLFDMPKLDRELRECGERSLKSLWEASRDAKKSIGWSISLKAYQDVYCKEPDVFVWTICTRDVSKLDEEDRKRLCMAKQQKLWDTRNHSSSESDYLSIADSLIEKLRQEMIAEGICATRFPVLNAAITTDGDIPSTYHFRICDLSSRIRRGPAKSCPPHDGIVY